MECIEISGLAEKYEVGELRGNKKKQFEHHIKNCKKCHARYGALLLLGAIMASSAKGAVTDVGSGISVFMKVKAIIGITALLTIGTIGVTVLKDKKELNSGVISEQMKILSVKDKKELVGEAVKEIDVLKTLKSESGFKIISKSDEKEVEITVDRKSLRFNNRVER